MAFYVIGKFIATAGAILITRPPTDSVESATFPIVVLTKD